MPVSTAGMVQEVDTVVVKDKEERQRIARVHEEARSFNIEEWEDIQATIKADEELAQRIQAEEREKYSEAEKARLLTELIYQRKRYFTQQRAEERRNKPLTQAQQRTYMSNYIKHMGSDKTVHELTTGSSKRDAEVELDHEGSKKQKTNEASGVGNHTEAYQTFDDMLKWSLVKERFSSTDPTNDKERILWVQLKRLFEPDTDDILWKLQRYMHDPLTWRLYDTCGVHHVSTDRGHDIFMLVEKDYPLTRGLLTLMLCNKLQVDQYSEMGDELLRKIGRLLIDHEYQAARYEIEGIEDMVPTLWSPTKVGEGDFVDLHINDIEHILLLVVQHKLFHLTDSDIVDFIVALRMLTRSLVIKKHVEDLQLGVESYQKKLNITPPQQTILEIKFKEPYTPSHKPTGVIYEDLVQQKRVMWADELYKFSNGTLKKVKDELHHRVLDFELGYNKEMERRKWTAIDKKRSTLMVELIDKQMRERRIIQNLERLVGAWELEMKYKLMTRTV
ncbi:hypothetical protein Tco_0555450 [Tanacetum coccineum]